MFLFICFCGFFTGLTLVGIAVRDTRKRQRDEARDEDNRLLQQKEVENVKTYRRDRAPTHRQVLLRDL